MSTKKTLGGERLGSGNKMEVELHGFNRSTHNIGQLFKTDQAIGTLVPYFCDLGMNGTTYEIDLTTKIRTLPTTGPIFGRLKHQIDVFHAPIRLYIRVLHNNTLNIGRNMQEVKIPNFSIRANQPDFNTIDLNSQQISQDSLLAYIGIRGLGKSNSGQTSFTRKFPAMFLLMYWDIYKNYYSNKQEEVGFVITPGSGLIDKITLMPPTPDPIPGGYVETQANQENGMKWSRTDTFNTKKQYLVVRFKVPVTYDIVREQKIFLSKQKGGQPEEFLLGDTNTWNISPFRYAWDKPGQSYKITSTQIAPYYYLEQEKKATEDSRGSIALTQFDLANIDEMREAILAAPKTTPFNVATAKIGLPYEASTANSLVPEKNPNGNQSYFTQVGLGIKTYMSDRFNNWLSTEWIDGTNGVNEISAIDVSSGVLKIDALIFGKKVFEMLNRIAISDGTYTSWQEVQYDEKAIRIVESPMYCGGMSSEIVFDEVVSNSATEIEGDVSPLGSLAGRGAERMQKGGRAIKIKIREPSMIMIIGSFTPRVDYSQGNKWWNRLETMNDFHKPSLDGIGFQELITDEMAAFDTSIDKNGQVIYKSAGKQPAWIEYMTNVDQSFGSFSAYGELAHMAMNRSYEHDQEGNISDLTTYIDPTKYNVAFADAKLSAKNIWVQCAIDCNVRRKMSARQIPNL